MFKITESDLLRLSMILENQGETTRNKYICKLTEFIIYDSQCNALSALEICKGISDRFQLDFDVLEIENAIALKGRGRIIFSDRKYRLNAKVNDQLSTQTSSEDKLKGFVNTYAKKTNNVDPKQLFDLIQKHLYYCFNSNAKNFNSIIGSDLTVCVDEEVFSEFKPTPDEIELINGFMNWDNPEKNKLLYSIVSSCYEYCLITTKKNPAISKAIFKGKKFFLDTNIIFRIAGINQDEREFVIRTFVDKCREVGVTLYYTSSVLNEIYRVIDAQVNYIRSITRYQMPVDSDIISRISYRFDTNDFYKMFCDWCKEPQNKYHDYLSFRNFLIKKINNVISEFEYIDSTNLKSVKKDRVEELFEDLKTYKTDKRSYRITTDDSVRTDINQVLFVESLRPQSATNLWEMNEYIVSADQLFVAWADKAFEGLPMVVIPSLWLSIILKVSGRASNNDYKSFCMFMTLRHHHSDEDEININPIELLARLSEKTVNKQIKELIINELLTNKNEYSFDSEQDYEVSIEKAFDKILSQEKNLHKDELEKAVAQEKYNSEEALDRYKKELERKKSAEEYAQTYAINKAKSNVEWFAQRENIPLVIEIVLPVLVALIIIVGCFVIKNQFLISLLTDILKSEQINERIWSSIVWIFNLGIFSLPTYIMKVWKYLSSEKRQDKLCSKYFKEQLRVLNDE